MTFAEKLDFLMNITKTTNSQLARNIALDASFISRLRRGMRTPVENAGYVPVMARYFSRLFNADYQKAALDEAIKKSSGIKPNDSETFEDLLCKWLLESKLVEPAPIDDFLQEFSNFQFKRPTSAGLEETARVDTRALADVEIFLGVEGKRTAVLNFLSLVLQHDNPQTLLLYSNEDLSWLSDDPEYFNRWASLMFQVLKSGNRIKMIHTLNRNLDEMLNGIKGWVPIYMTGSIEPYYYPKTRDGIFRRTLFIAPETVAVTSSSVRNSIESNANLLFTRPEAIQALKSEYIDFLALCRPLMRIFNPFHQENCIETMREFEAEKGNVILKTNSLTHMTMPPSVAASVLGRFPHKPSEHLLVYQEEKINQFHELLKEHRFTEIISLPEREKVLKGEAMINFSDMPGIMPMFYTPEEYKLHLHNIIHLLKIYPNYHVYFTQDEHLEESMVYVKEDVGVLVGKISSPSVIFAINESNITAAFWDYMNVLLQKNSADPLTRQGTISHLESIIAQLEG